MLSCLIPSSLSKVVFYSIGLKLEMYDGIILTIKHTMRLHMVQGYALGI